MKYKREKLTTTNLDISGKDFEVELFRNEEGNLEIFIQDDENWLDEGWSLDSYEDEIIICKYSSRW